MLSSQKAPPPERAGSKNLRADISPAATPIEATAAGATADPAAPRGRDEAHGPRNIIPTLPGNLPWTVDAFMWLAMSCHDGKFYEAHCAQQALRRYGWDVTPCSKEGD